MNESDQIFDAIGKFNLEIIRLDDIRRKRAQITDVKQKRCDNCHHWLKTSCKPGREKREPISGRSFVCEDFELSIRSERSLEKFKLQLANMTEQSVRT